MNNTYEKYMQHRKDELYHYNPNHDPRNGQFASGKATGISKLYFDRSDNQLKGLRPNYKKAARLRRTGAKIGRFGAHDVVRDVEYRASQYGSEAAEVAKKIMKDPHNRNNDIFMKDVEDLQRMAKRYKKLARVLEKKMKDYPGSSDKPKINNMDFDVWVRKNDKRVAEVLDKYYWG